MYAIIETGGKQYKVEVGSFIEIEKLPGEAGLEVLFDKVLLINKGEEILVGTPYIKNATVSGKIVKQFKGKKIRIFKYTPKERYRKRQGHRKQLSRVRIDEIKVS